VFATQTDAPYFGVPFEETKADVSFRELADSERFEISDVRVACTRLNHPYVATAYRLTVDGASVVYVSDTAPFDDILFEDEFIARPPSGAELPRADREKLRAMRAGVVRLCEGADLVIYDTMFTAADYQKQPHFGHSRPSDAVAICREAGVKSLALYHHAPERADSEIDQIVTDTRTLAHEQGGGLEIIAAFEGLELNLGKR
jgi:ribonuclease BN (tRNA processing enzyme)